MKILSAITALIVSLALSFFCFAGVVWGICILLPMFGVVAIGTWTVAFSWKLVLLLMLIITLLRIVFRSEVEVTTKKR